MHMRIILIGSNGQLGTDLRKVLPPETLALDWPEFDVRQSDQVREVFQRERPEQVINCAAMTNVDLCEDETSEAFAVNTLGALHVARCAEEVGAAVYYVSTDYVFGADTTRTEPYTEDDTPGPINVYGASKLAGEHLTIGYNSRACVIRTCGLYGHAGARGKGGNFIETMLRLANEGKPIRVVNDQRLSPTSTAECARCIRDLGERRVIGLYHVAAPDSCTWFEFSRAIFECAHLNADPQPISTHEYQVRARRPMMSALQTRRLTRIGVEACSPWLDMLHEYMNTRSNR